ncbi:OmpA family protein [Lujinxingia vulgaris]|uniref:OmpA family protein n=1 Tax=Lujinxingia vulgaris TaxID=2600176 RepID=A0A5C6XHD8_9DELT|nr:flagellar motor protein MotB [Lujinxingia vulgaris]TXD36884.1 OmpA family protein [Lujinxingia vulgaris]
MTQLIQERFNEDVPTGQAGWLVSYADMMTILLTFMILLLSISTIAQTKYDLLVQAFTGSRAGNLHEVQEKIDRVIEEQALGGEVQTLLDDEGLKIQFSNALLFNSGSAELLPRALEVFGPIERHLVDDLGPTYGLVIEGYTDDVPVVSGRYRSNWELSTSRAIHVMERLAAAGLDRRRMSVQGFADTRPATEVDLYDTTTVDALDEAALNEVRGANRRVVIRIDALDPDLVQRLYPDADSPGDAVPESPQEIF